MLLFLYNDSGLPVLGILMACSCLFLLSWKGYGRTWEGPEAGDRYDQKQSIASIARMTEWAGSLQPGRDDLKQILDVYRISSGMKQLDRN